MISAINQVGQTVPQNRTRLIQRQSFQSQEIAQPEFKKASNKNISFGAKGSQLITWGERIIYGGVGVVGGSALCCGLNCVNTAVGLFCAGLVVCLAGIITRGLGFMIKD